MGIILCLLTVFLLAKNVIRNRNELVSPRTFFLLGFLMVLGRGALEASLAESGEHTEAFQQVMTWSIIGLLAFEVGGWIRKIPRPLDLLMKTRHRFQPKYLFLLVLLFSAIGILSMVFFSYLYDLSPTDYLISLRTLQLDDELDLSILRYFSWVGNVGILAGSLAFALLLWQKWAWWQRLVLIFIVLLAIPLTFQGGGRFPVLQYLSSLAIMWYLKKHWSLQHLRWLKYVGIAAVACFALVSTSIVSEYRSTGLKDVDWSNVEPFSTERIEADTNMLSSTVDAFEFFPKRHDYLFGSTFAVLPVTYIPRAWWPGKPEALGLIMVELRNPGEVTYSEAVSTIGELYVNFGVLGIPLGMLIYGFTCQLLYLLYCRNQTNLYFLVFYVLSLPFFTMHVRGEFVTVWAHYLSLAVPLYLGMRLCRKRILRSYVSRSFGNGVPASNSVFSAR